MSADRELLELAAKAYWIDEIDDVVSIEWSDENGGILYSHGENQDHNGMDRTYVWNTLENYNQALQLAVKCGIAVTPYPIYEWPKHSVVAARKSLEDSRTEVVEPYGDDAVAATCLAITRAAAEIGRQMP